MKRLVLLSLLLTIPFSPSAGAAGFSLFEQGAKATAVGGAFTATADDPSAIFYNVAGLAYQREMSATAGATFITFASEFVGDPGSPYPGAGVSEFYAEHVFIIPNAHLVIPIGENASFGIGQFTPFGLRTDWEDPNRFSGRFISQDANIKSLAIQPSFAMKSSDGRFAGGVGLQYMASHISFERNIPAVFVDRIYDAAHVRLNSDWNDGWGWNVGLMYRPNDNWSFGASYRAPIEIDFEGDAKFIQIPTGSPQLDAVFATRIPPNQNITTAIEFPSFLHLGVATTLIPNWRVELNVVETGWSSFDQLLVDFETTPEANLFIPQEWEDSRSYRIGGSRPVTDHWTIRLGAVYDETPQPLEGAGPLLPDADRYGVTFGLGWQRGPWTVDVTEFALFFAERDTRGQNRDNFNGTYETNANLVSINVGYTF